MEPSCFGWFLVCLELFSAPSGCTGGFNGPNGPRGCPGGSGSGYTGRGRRATKPGTPSTVRNQATWMWVGGRYGWPRRPNPGPGPIKRIQTANSKPRCGRHVAAGSFCNEHRFTQFFKIGWPISPVSSFQDFTRADISPSARPT